MTRMDTAATATIAPDQIPTPMLREFPHRELETLLETVIDDVSIALPWSKPAASRAATAKPNNNMKTAMMLALTNGQYDLHTDSNA